MSHPLRVNCQGCRFLQISLFQSFAPFSCLFFGLSGGAEQHLGYPEMQDKGLFLKYSWICLDPHLLNPYLWHSNLSCIGQTKTLQMATLQMKIWLFFFVPAWDIPAPG